MQKDSNSSMKKVSEWDPKHYFLLNTSIILFLSLLTVNRYGPSELNADIILNTLISLQNVTLFYWGQDRLLNVLPFMLAPIRLPALNIFLVMFLSALCYYLLLWQISRFFLYTFASNDLRGKYDQHLVFFILVGSGLFLLAEYTMFNMTIWLVHFTLSYFLLSLVHFSLVREDYFDSYDKVFMFFLIFIATGLNNSIIVPAIIMVTVHVFIDKFKLNQVIYLGFTLITTFIAWAFISRQYGSGSESYFNLDLENFTVNLQLAFDRITEALNMVSLGLTLSLIFLLFVCLLFKKQFRLVAGFSGLALFIGAWFVIFANNEWVIINDYHFRYFFPVLISLTVLLASSVVILLQKVNMESLKRALTLLLSVFILASLAKPLTGICDYNVFTGPALLAEERATGETTFHAGDYWQAWPAVLYDLICGRSSYGFAYRAEGNLDNLLAAAERELDRKGQLIVYCHVSERDDCTGQVLNRLSGLELESRELVVPGIEELTFTNR